MRIEIFDDELTGPLCPLLWTRSIADLRLGAMTARERAEWAERKLGGADTGPLAVARGRWLAGSAELAGLVELGVGRAWTVGETVVAARLDADASQRWADAGDDAARDAVLAGLTAEALPGAMKEAVLAEHVGHLLDRQPGLLRTDLEAMGGADATLAAVHSTAVIDASGGAVRIEAGATVGPMAVIEGPCWIGPGATVAPHAHLRSMTVIGRGCKVGGEVSASVMGDYSNKAHYGYLGNSLIGAWCNLGAGTVTSNLKNTYGPVRMQPTADGPALDTGRDRVGTVMGDFVRTGIGTRLNTGSWIEPAVSLAMSAIAPKRVGAFSFVTDAGDRLYDWGAFETAVARMMSRKNEALSESQWARLRGLHAKAAAG
ncbi:MAG: putative sugar nucleotidyl transferase, partial [Planctomycetota bacterium]